MIIIKFLQTGQLITLGDINYFGHAELSVSAPSYEAIISSTKGLRSC